MDSALRAYRGWKWRATAWPTAGAFRLRLGDYRVMLTLEDNTLRIFAVLNRREAYR